MLESRPGQCWRPGTRVPGPQVPGLQNFAWASESWLLGVVLTQEQVPPLIGPEQLSVSHCSEAAAQTPGADTPLLPACWALLSCCYCSLTRSPPGCGKQQTEMTPRFRTNKTSPWNTEEIGTKA